MALRDWSTSRILYLWLGVALYMLAWIIVIGLQNRHVARSIPPSLHVSPPSTDTTLTPAQLASRDSLLDSLKALASQYLNSEEGKRAIQGIGRALKEAFATIALIALVVSVLWLAPAVTMTIVTIVWWRRRRATPVGT